MSAAVASSLAVIRVPPLPDLSPAACQSLSPASPPNSFDPLSAQLEHTKLDTTHTPTANIATRTTDTNLTKLDTASVIANSIVAGPPTLSTSIAPLPLHVSSRVSSPVPVPVPVAKKITLDSFGNEIRNDPDTGYYDEIEIEDMEFDSEKRIYTYPCPCGDKFSIRIEELADGEEIAKCPSCSLVIRVIYEPEDFANEEDDDGY